MAEVPATPYEAYIRLPELSRTWPDLSAGVDLIRFVCGFQAVELHLRLTEQILDDRRPAADTPRRLDEVVRGAAAGLRYVAAGRADAHPSRPVSGGTPLSAEARRILRRLPARHQRTLDELLDGLTWPGPEDHVLVRPDEVHALRDFPWQGPEDAMFRSVHQITECWLHIALSEGAEAAECVGTADWRAAAAHVTSAAGAVRLAIDTNDLLELMVPADFHPLRVRLRDGTAAHSTAARRMMRLPAELTTLLSGGSRDQAVLFDLLDQPDRDLDRYAYLRSVSELAKRAQTFLCHHYLLVLDMLGTDTRGTLGQEVRKLAERATRPVVPDLDQARHDVALFASLEHGATSGTLSSSSEAAAGIRLPASRPGLSDCPDAAVRQGISRYFRAIAEREPSAWVALFAPVSGTLFDVRGTRPHVGAQKLRLFIGSTFEAFSEIRHTYVIDSIDRGVADVRWTVDAVSYLGTNATFTGTERFYFSTTGEIARADAEWDPTDVARQIRPGRPRT
ncbi:nuclear transport factor 2 family protein [Lentzea sp. NPDC059081]|uniref:nuclear transport factor 2 family protein n=1 Tax=Lentzea sp. NPDC059081 TaxID=3346719 RepID=UPI00368133F5